MRISLSDRIALSYKSPSQITRVLTENWVEASAFCPNCGSRLSRFRNNSPVADFLCNNCDEEYELKSKKNSFGSKIVDGAYGTMIERLNCENNPNFFMLSYDLKNLEVLNFFVVPKHFFTPEIIEKRNPLAKTARRADWTGCNILLKNIPSSGKIFYIENKRPILKKTIFENWSKTLFLREEKNAASKSWIIDTIACVEELEKQEFSLDEVYAFEDALRKKHPQNNFIKDKIRQQLQLLRDRGFLDFVGRGRYRLIGAVKGRKT